MTTTDIDALQNQLFSRIEELEAEKLALLEENTALAAALADVKLAARIFHPSFAAEMDRRAIDPTASLARRDARMKAEALEDMAKGVFDVPLIGECGRWMGVAGLTMQHEAEKYRHQAEGGEP